MTSSTGSTPRERVFALVNAERQRQTEKWGDQWARGNTPPETKLAILVEEVGEVAKETLESSEESPSLRKELVQCAAVCVAWLESLEFGKDLDEISLIGQELQRGDDS